MKEDSEQIDTEVEFVIPTAGFVQDAIIPIACCFIFGLILAGGSIAVVMGRMSPPESRGIGSALREPDDQVLSTIGGIVFLGMGVRLCYKGLVYSGKPFVFDRRTDQLRLGAKPLCRLSEIRLVLLKEQKVEEDSTFQLFLTLANGRRIGFGPFLQFSREGAETRKSQIESFLGLAPLHLPKRPEPACDSRSTISVWERELDEG